MPAIVAAGEVVEDSLVVGRIDSEDRAPVVELPARFGGAVEVARAVLRHAIEGVRTIRRCFERVQYRESLCLRLKAGHRNDSQICG